MDANDASAVDVKEEVALPFPVRRRWEVFGRRRGKEIGEKCPEPDEGMFSFF